MRTFESLHDVELELKKKNLERQLLREEIKHNYLSFQQRFESNWFSNPIIAKLSKIGIQYIINRIRK